MADARPRIALTPLAKRALGVLPAMRVEPHATDALCRKAANPDNWHDEVVLWRPGMTPEFVTVPIGRMNPVPCTRTSEEDARDVEKLERRE